jgi:transposase
MFNNKYTMEDVAVDWNSGKSVKEIAKKAGASVPTVRNWINIMRKKGVNLEKRVRHSHIEFDVDGINKRLRSVKRNNA